jgi:hypothetical protein
VLVLRAFGVPGRLSAPRELTLVPGRVRLRLRLGSRSEFLNRKVAPRLQSLWEMVTFPTTVLYLFLDPRIDPSYGLSWAGRMSLAWRMLRTVRHVDTATSYKAHLAIAVKLLEIPREVEGAVVECGCFLGGSSANLSLACAIVGRELIVYDSFEGLPAPKGNDKYARAENTGFLRADLFAVHDNVRRFGAIDPCHIPQRVVRRDAIASYRAGSARLRRRRLPSQPRRVRPQPVASSDRVRLHVHR